jgi:hypothetical protein
VTQITGSLGYYVEDRILVQLSAFEQQSEKRFVPTDFPASGSTRNSDHNHTILLSLSYQFSGRLSAPGLYEPQGLMQAGTGP